MTRKTSLTLLALMVPTAALAHSGHVTDAGVGHSHIVGYAAAVAAIAIALGGFIKFLRSRNV